MDKKQIMRLIDSKREHMKIPIATFARMCDMGRGHYYDIVNGKGFSVDVMLRMFKQLNLDFEDFTYEESNLYINGQKTTRHDELLKKVECWEMIEQKWKSGESFSDIEVAFQMPRGTLTKKIMKEQEKDLYKIKLMI